MRERESALKKRWKLGEIVAGGKEWLSRSLRCWTVEVGVMWRVMDSPVRVRIWIPFSLLSSAIVVLAFATTWEMFSTIFRFLFYSVQTKKTNRTIEVKLAPFSFTKFQFRLLTNIWIIYYFYLFAILILLLLSIYKIIFFILKILLLSIYRIILSVLKIDRFNFFLNFWIKK